MPLDAICLRGITGELESLIIGARIDKIQQPARDMILLSLHLIGGNARLLIAAGSGNARIHLTNASFQNPTDPPMFCMLLRKHLNGARITGVIQPDFERILILELDSCNDFGLSERKRLIVEMMGRSSNLILVGCDGIIIDCLRRKEYGDLAKRSLWPGMIYRMPPSQIKPNLFFTTNDERKKAIQSADKNIPVEKWLMENYSGLSPLICREIAYRCEEDYSLLRAQLDAFVDSVLENELRPYLFYNGQTPFEFSFMDLHQYGTDIRRVCHENFSGMLDNYYSSRDILEQQRRRSRELTKTVKAMRDRLVRKLANQAEEYRQTENRDKIRKTAELITANIYRIRKGDRILRCEDYYDPDCPEISIALDPFKSPQQNAAALFKEYAKQKAARGHLERLIREGEQKLDYLNSVLGFIEDAESETDLSALRQELVETGIIREEKKGKSVKKYRQPPLRFRSEDGFEILAGRSNMQNDELTVKTGRRTDYWFHAQRIHGSHVILRCEGMTPSEMAIEQAAAIAAYYSHAHGAGKVPVDYTMICHVKKPAGAMPGKVIYTNYKTVTVESDESLLKKLRIQ